MAEKEKLRIDKYLWAIRAFKTRSLATEACKAGRIKLGGTALKPAHVVKVGEVYVVQKGGLKKTIKVLALLEKRMDAKSVVAYYEDLTPPEETHAFKSVFLSPILTRDRGAGRPTKKDRREIDELQEGWFEED